MPELVLSPFADDWVSEGVIGKRFTFSLNREGQVTYLRPPVPERTPRVVKVLREALAGGRHLLTVDWQGYEFTYLLPEGMESPEAGTLTKLTAADGEVRSLGAVRTARHEAVVVAAEPRLGRLTIMKDGRTRMLRVGRTAIYAIPHPYERVYVGEAVRLTDISPGDPVWLDDEDSSDYILVFLSGRG